MIKIQFFLLVHFMSNVQLYPIFWGVQLHQRRSYRKNDLSIIQGTLEKHGGKELLRLYQHWEGQLASSYSILA